MTLFYSATTRGIRVSVAPSYDESRSNSETSSYLYIYKITIENEGKETVQLISRHWIIQDGFGRMEHVVGPGVVGQQPVLPPGETFEYSSFCPLATPTGSMKGTYKMKAEDSGDMFDVSIPEFPLVHQSLVN